MNEFEFDPQQVPQERPPVTEPIPRVNYIPYRPPVPVEQEQNPTQAPRSYGIPPVAPPPVQEPVAPVEEQAPYGAEPPVPYGAEPIAQEQAPYEAEPLLQEQPFFGEGYPHEPYQAQTYDPGVYYGYPPSTGGVTPEQNFRGQGYIPGVPVQKPKKKKPQARFTGRALLIFAICFSLIGSLLGACFVVLLQRHYAQKEEQAEVNYLLEGYREKVDLSEIPVDTSKLMTPAEVYAANVSSTVGITTTSTTTNFWGYRTTSAASGSGFFISDNGHILTNFHVIEGSDSISVTLYSGESYEAKLLGYDESNDIAVLQIEGVATTPVILGDSDEINVGDSVVAIGNPLGELTFSLTSGSVSAKDREVTFSGSVPMELIQTDCAINSGNSGGALFNLYGEVIGVTNAKYSGNSGSATIDNIGFAIPLNSIREIIRSIIEDGYILKSYAGVSVADLGFEAQWYGLPYGAYVQGVDPAGPAAQLLTEGDIIVGVDGRSISSSAELLQLVERAQPGQSMLLTVYRQGKNLELTLTVGQTQRSAIPNSQGGNAYY